MNEIIFLWLNNLVVAYPGIAPVAVFVAAYLGWVILASLLLVILLAKDKRRATAEVVAIGLVATAAWAASAVSKLVFASPRPYLVMPNIHPLLAHVTDYSFPSGHATFFFALALATYHYRKSLGLWFIVGAFAIGVARIAVGVHFPVDIIGGFVLGGIVAFLGSFVTSWIVRKLTLPKSQI